jgi:hypothetical protein
MMSPHDWSLQKCIGQACTAKRWGRRNLETDLGEGQPVRYGGLVDDNTPHISSVFLKPLSLIDGKTFLIAVIPRASESSPDVDAAKFEARLRFNGLMLAAR